MSKITIKKDEKEWFDTWFHTRYYDMLYAHRDQSEATNFVQNLYHTLGMRAGEKALDVPCGGGRHAFVLHKQGLETTGLDINSALIDRARADHKGIRFDVHDMRVPYESEAFDYVLNLFTSFGYFDQEKDNQVAVSAWAQALRRGGRIVIDFFNAKKLRKALLPKETRVIDDVTFHIERKIVGNYVQKHIEIHPKEAPTLHFCEYVMLLEKEHFVSYLNEANCALIATYGSYNLASFNVETSERLILVGKKR